MRRYTFCFYEYDSQMPSSSKHYFIKIFGHNWKHACNKAQQYVERRNRADLDYHSELLSHGEMVNIIKQRHSHSKNYYGWYLIFVGILALIIWLFWLSQVAI